MKRIIQLFLILVACESFADPFRYNDLVKNGSFESSSSSNPLGKDYSVSSSGGASFSIESRDTFDGSRALRVRKSSRNKTTKLTVNDNGKIEFRSPLSSVDERLFKCHIAAKLLSRADVTTDETPCYLRISSSDNKGNDKVYFVRVPYRQGVWSDLTKYILVPKNTTRFFVSLHIKYTTDIVIDDISITNSFLDSSMANRIYRPGETLDIDNKIVTPNGEDLSGVKASMTIDTVEVDVNSRGDVRDISDIVFEKTGVSPGRDGKISFPSVKLDSRNFPADHVYRLTVEVKGNGAREMQDHFFLVTQNSRTPRFYWDLNRDGKKELTFPLGFNSTESDDGFEIADLGWADFIRGGRSLLKHNDDRDFGVYVYPPFHFEFERFLFEDGIAEKAIDTLVKHRDNRWTGGVDIGGEPADDGISPEQSAWAYNLTKSLTPDRPVIQMVHRVEAFEIGMWADSLTLWPNFKDEDGGFSTDNIRFQIVERMADARKSTNGRVPIFGLIPANFLRKTDTKPEPTPNEMRCVSVLFLTLDVNGLMFNADRQNYIFRGGQDRSLRSFERDAPALFDVIMDVGEAVGSMKNAMLGSNSSNVKLDSGNTSDLKFIAKEDSKNLFVAISNYSSRSKDLVFTLGSTSQDLDTRTRELLRNRSVNLSVSGGKYILRVSISGKDGHIYRISKNSDGNSSPPPPSSPPPSSPPPSSPPPSNDSGKLVALWNMEDGRGKTASDKSGERNHASIHGAIFRSPKVGKSSLRFDGRNDYAVVGDSSSLDASSAVTIAAWIHPDNLRRGNESQFILSKSGAYRMFVRRDRQVRFQIYNPRSNRISSQPTVTIPDKKWTHVAGTYDGKKLKVYINGKLEKTVSFSGSIRINRNPLYFGAENKREKRFFDGKIDDLRVYKKALRASEITGLFRKK